jgi:hypothetical protein
VDFAWGKVGWNLSGCGFFADYFLVMVEEAVLEGVCDFAW